MTASTSDVRVAKLRMPRSPAVLMTSMNGAKETSHGHLYAVGKELVKVGLGCSTRGGAPVHACLDGVGVLVDNSLRVDPAALIGAAQQFRNTHEGLRDVLTTIGRGHDALQGKWTGGAASKGARVWADLNEAFRAHIDQLADTADKLHSAAGQYSGQDGTSGADIDRQM